MRAYELVEALKMVKNMKDAIEGIKIVEDAIDTFIDDPNPTNRHAVIVGAGLLLAFSNLEYLKSIVGFLPEVIAIEIRLKQKSVMYIAKLLIS